MLKKIIITGFFCSMLQWNLFSQTMDSINLDGSIWKVIKVKPTLESKSLKNKPALEKEAIIVMSEKTLSREYYGSEISFLNDTFYFKPTLGKIEKIKILEKTSTGFVMAPESEKDEPQIVKLDYNPQWKEGIFHIGTELIFVTLKIQ